MREADDDGPRVEAVVYPRPDYEGEPWSQWGQGVVLPDGRFISAIGDHRGEDGNSYVYAYDPSEGRLTQFVDVLSVVDHDEGDWGYGKVHGQMVLGSCDEVFFATYWGSRDGLEYDGSYEGDHLLSLDTSTLTVDDVGVPIPEHGIPSLAGPNLDGLLYGEAVDPTRDEERDDDLGAFFVYDTDRDELEFRTDDDRASGFRNIAVTASGRAFIAGDGRKLLEYEPGADELSNDGPRVPEGWLRASTAPSADGTVYGVTTDPEVFFALRPDGSVENMGAARGYTTSVALDDERDRVFSVPGAHGDAFRDGTPILALETETGAEEVLVELNDLAEKELGLTLGGTYNLAVDPNSDTLYAGFNAGASRDEPWGEVVLVIVHLEE